MWDIDGILSTLSGAVPRLQLDSVPLHFPDLPAPHRSHSAYPLRTWHWYERKHGYAGCCILMYDSAERGDAMLRGTSFCYIIAALLGEEGYYTELYSDHSAEDQVLQMTARFARDRDRDACTLHFELHSTRPICIEH